MEQPLTANKAGKISGLAATVGADRDHGQSSARSRTSERSVRLDLDAHEGGVAASVHPDGRDGRTLRHRVLERRCLVLRQEPALDAALEPPVGVVTPQVEAGGGAGPHDGATDPDVTVAGQWDPGLATVAFGLLGLGQLGVDPRLARQVRVAELDVGTRKGDGFDRCARSRTSWPVTVRKLRPYATATSSTDTTATTTSPSRRGGVRVPGGGGRGGRWWVWA